MKRFLAPAIILTTVIISLVLILQVDRFLKIKERELKNDAIDGCMSSTRYTKNEGNGETTETYVDWYYNQCMKNKGF